MKNKLIIDIDTERDDSVIITKPEEFIPKDTSIDETKKMVLNDVISLCNALGTLINVSDDSKYFTSTELANKCVEYFQGNFLTKKQ